MKQLAVWLVIVSSMQPSCSQVVFDSVADCVSKKQPRIHGGKESDHGGPHGCWPLFIACLGTDCLGTVFWSSLDGNAFLKLN